MPLRHRTTLSGILGAAILAAPVYGQAQDPASNSVGPPVLRDFQLKGETTVRPPPAPPPAPVPAPPPAPAPGPTPSPTPPPSPAPQSEQPAARPTPTPAIGATLPAPSPQPPPLPSPAVSIPITTITPAAPSGAPSPVEVPAEQAEPVPASVPDGGIPWLYVLFAAAALPLAFAAVRWRRREREDPESPVPAAELFARPEPEPAAPLAPRPWLELEFRPGKAAATDARATLDYELVIRNVGDVEARNIRTEARMFNAGKQQDSEIGAFFASSANRIAPAPRPLQPQSAAKFQSVVALAKEDVREVVVQGRRLFIPMVAFNVFYEWGEGETGQSSKSYLVGRESQPPAEKMAPFRLDLGPRIYRSVGSRPSNLALSV